MDYKKISLKNISANLLVYGTAHAIVDGICAAVIFSIFNSQIGSAIDFISLAIIYNVLAFGLQSIFGLVIDYFKSPRLAALSGCILTGAGAATFFAFPVAAIIFAGLGNALFHVGGGSISLNLTPKKAAAPGIYVAPGALGLLIGTLLGKSGKFVAWQSILALVILCFFMFVIEKPEMDYGREETQKKGFNYFGFILILVFLSIAIRSLVGMVLVFPWKTNLDLLVVLTGAIVLGKGLGGILADKFGWVRVAVGALILSIPFLIFGGNVPFLAIIGMFLFNITMPITLVVISNILPGRPGFAFGLTCLALILGALPVFSRFKQFFGGQLFIFVIIAVSSLALYYALKVYFGSYQDKKIGG
jgi:MFS transporter, FSR family, fosmidomycin resistance protein